jgi:AcrR family transcriptional regulator
MPKRVDKNAKKGMIAQAAIGVFRSTGYHRARMADIAEAAGIGKGTIYEYFRDKAEILRFEFDRYFDAFSQGALGALRPDDTPGRQLLALVEFALSHVETWRDHCAVYMDYFTEARTSEQRLFSLAHIYGEMRGLLTGLIEKGREAGELSAEVDPTATADLLISLYDGVVLHDVFDRSHGGSLSRMRSVVMRLITSGLFTGGPVFTQGRGRYESQSHL